MVNQPLLNQTRQILSLVFDYSMRATLVQSTITQMSMQDDLYIWHTDQGKQFGAQATIDLVIAKGLLPSMSRAGTRQTTHLLSDLLDSSNTLWYADKNIPT